MLVKTSRSYSVPAAAPPRPWLIRSSQKRGERRIEVQPSFTQVGDNTLIGSTQWMGADGVRYERFRVLTLRDGKIVDMQGCASRRTAERFARRY
jgi:hypothetical protein